MSEPLYRQRLQLFPETTRIIQEAGCEALSIAGCSLTDLAGQYGTPLYLYDRATMDGAVQAYRSALADYPGEAGITYAGKAWLNLAVVQWAMQNDLLVDCTGAGEIHVAVCAGAPKAKILVHGVNKSQADIQAAVAKAGTIVVDNLSELKALAGMANQSALPNLWLRLRPGLAVDTHAHTQTGQSDSKFGMSAGELSEAVEIGLAAGLPLTGIHFHQGSHFHDPSPLRPAIETALELIMTIRNQSGWYPQIVCTGGGWGVPYHESELPHPSIGDYVRTITVALERGCRQRGLRLPCLQLEPGRSLVARAGVALYRIGAVKHSDARRWLLLDGGMVDNPRPALYGVRYSALPVREPHRLMSGPAWLAGPYCESGDILIQDLPMPDVLPGELVAIPVSGAYQLSMGSNYNGARRPAVLWLENGTARLIQRRETLDDLVRRDYPL